MKNGALIVILFLIGLCFSMLGCETAQKKVMEADTWVRENMW